MQHIRRDPPDLADISIAEAPESAPFRFQEHASACNDRRDASRQQGLARRRQLEHFTEPKAAGVASASAVFATHRSHDARKCGTRGENGLRGPVRIRRSKK